MYEHRDAIGGISVTPVKPRLPDQVRSLLEGRASSGQRAAENLRAVRCENVSSARILEKIETRREGVFVKNWMIRDNWRDAFLYAMLDSEWRKIEEPKMSPVTGVIHLERRTAT